MPDPFVKALRCAGFTTIELVVTMILVGIMAFVALPRLSNLGDFDARGAGDQLASILRFAQKTALAQRRYVTVTVASATAAPTLIIGSACSTGTAMALPASFRAPAVSVSLSAGGTVCFDTVGGTGSAASFAFSSGGTVIRTVTVESVTGYVRAS